MLTEYTTPMIYDHLAVCLEHFILIIGGSWKTSRYNAFSDDNRVTWMINICTEQRTKHVIPEGQIAPPTTRGACAVVVGQEVYMFGGIVQRMGFTNELWKLNSTSKGSLSLVWCNISITEG